MDWGGQLVLHHDGLDAQNPPVLPDGPGVGPAPIPRQGGQLQWPVPDFRGKQLEAAKEAEVPSAGVSRGRA